MSRDVRKPDFCICENKDADQLRGNHEADQRLCFRYLDSAIPLLPTYKTSSLWPFFWGCAAWFVLGPGRKPQGPVSEVAAQMFSCSTQLSHEIYHSYTSKCSKANNCLHFNIYKYDTLYMTGFHYLNRSENFVGTHYSSYSQTCL